MKTFPIYIALVISVLMMGCEYDNYDAPGSFLHGHVVYDGDPLGFRTNATQMEIWQDGYELSSLIPVFIAQDGSYSVSLFDGEYKLVRRAGGSWVPNTADTLIITVKGDTEYDIPVTPYYHISESSFESDGSTVSVSFSLDQVEETATLGDVKLYLGYSAITDNNKYEAMVSADVSAVSLSESNLMEITIPDNLLDAGYLFARVGVRASQAGEYTYTQVQKVEL